jgi:hypothetical protein
MTGEGAFPKLMRLRDVCAPVVVCSFAPARLQAEILKWSVEQ